MKTYQFIHPRTAEVFYVDAEWVFDEDKHWRVKIKEMTVAVFTKDYSFVLATTIEDEARGE